MSRAKDEQKMLKLMSRPQAEQPADGRFGLMEMTGVALWLLVLAGATLVITYRFVLA